MLNKKKNKKYFWREVIAFAVIIIFVGFFLQLTLSRHAALKSFQNDLGTYSQLTWNTLHGDFFQASGALPIVTMFPDGTINEQFNYLSAHFSPLLLIFVPLYAIWADPRIFLIIQVLAVAFGALPIYWLAREKIKIFWAPLIFLVSFFFYPIIQNSLLYDFHEVTLAIPLVTFALWFLYKRKYSWLIVFLFLLLLVQEHTSLMVFMFGIYLFFFHQKKKLGLIISIISLIYFFSVVMFIMPAFSTTGEPIILKNATNFDNRYSWLGTSFSEIATTFLTKPLYVISNIFKISKIKFFILLLLPLLALPVFSGIFLLALPVLAINFLSQLRLTYSANFYHSAIIVGIFYFAAIYSFEKIFKDSKYQKILLVLILIITIFCGYFYSLSPFAKEYGYKDFTPSANAKLLGEVKELIPAEAALSIQHNLAPHFSTRKNLYQFPTMVSQVDYVIVDVFDPYYNNPKSFFQFNSALLGEQDYSYNNISRWLLSVEIMLGREDFGVIYYQDGWLVFKKGASHELNDEAKADFYKQVEKYDLLEHE